MKTNFGEDIDNFRKITSAICNRFQFWYESTFRTSLWKIAHGGDNYEPQNNRNIKKVKKFDAEIWNIVKQVQIL